MDAHGAGVFVFPDGALTPETVAVPRMAYLSLAFYIFIFYFFSLLKSSLPAQKIAATILAAATHFRFDHFQE